MIIFSSLPLSFNLSFDWLMLIDNLHVRLIFYLGKKKYIPVKNLLKLVKLQNLVYD
jgi:hypothetical protein